MSETLVKQMRGSKLCDTTLYMTLHGHSCVAESCSHCCLGGSIADRIEAEYMELPCDKNGEVIHVGGQGGWIWTEERSC